MARSQKHINWFTGRSTFGPNKAPKQDAPPAPRKPNFESLLCNAISNRMRVALQYDGDHMERLFEPSAVYWTSKRKVCVSGVQITNPEKPQDNMEPHNFEVGKISHLRLTDQTFAPDPRFSRSDPKYRNGIICSL